MNDGIAKSSASRRIVAGVAIAAAAFTGMGGGINSYLFIANIV